MDPTKRVVPIFAIDESNNIKHFLGTGTFVTDVPLLATALHVVKDWPGPFAIAVLPDTHRIVRAVLAARDEAADLALLEVPGYPASESVRLAEDSEISSNQVVVTFEYGTTRTAGKSIHLAPATRIGNVTRTLNLTDRFGKAGEEALELSFPALRGASGSPVLSNTTFRLWGIVIANVSYHLLPAQIETVIDEDGQLAGAMQFMLPQGIAVHVKHLRNLLAQRQAPLGGAAG